jgi:hypothetical protein
VYRITGASGHTDAFAVSWDSPESDLRPLAPDQQQALESLLGTPIHPSWPDAVRALGPGNPRIRFWPYALLFVVLIYLVETWFARYV